MIFHTQTVSILSTVLLFVFGMLNLEVFLAGGLSHPQKVACHAALAYGLTPRRLRSPARWRYAFL
jgi:hypothetical protein